MSKRVYKEREATQVILEATDAEVDDHARRLARKLKASTVIMPTEEEDAVITQAALSDPDNPPLTDEQLAQFKPARRGRPPQDVTKTPTSIRLDNVILDSFKATGDGWQTRVNQVLHQYLVDTQQLAHRFHITVQSRASESQKVSQFIVIAVSAGQAKEKVKQHLRDAGHGEDARGKVDAVDVGNAALRDLPVIM